MKAIIQRVNSAHIHINTQLHNKIDTGILVYLCVERGDTTDNIKWMIRKILHLKIFEPLDSKKKQAIESINGELLIVSQFTLAAECRNGNTPDFTQAENREKAKKTYDTFCTQLKESTTLTIKTGIFGEKMRVTSENNGPYTLIIKTKQIKN